MGNEAQNDPQLDDAASPLAAWFLGPRAENADIWRELLDHIFLDYVHWRRNYFPADPVIVNRGRRRSDAHEKWLDSLTEALDRALNDLKHHFPFHSPRYIGHMLSEQSLPSVLGLIAGLLFNPNNVTDEAAPVTVTLELEVGRMVAAMLGFNERRCWAHLTSGGTVANIEALWVARAVQFIPLFVRDYCAEQHASFLVKRADGSDIAICELTDRELLGLRPNEMIFMLRRLARFLQQHRRAPYSDVVADINAALAHSRFNVAKRGLVSVLRHIDCSPIVLISAAAHYSLAKAANVLGYGEDAVRLVPVTPRFQVDMGLLREAVLDLKDSEYLAAVVGIVGTTEEGAVDPVHRMRFLRDETEKTRHRSFWLHVDAAWGGYIRSLFCGVEMPRAPHGTSLETICEAYVRALRVEERVKMDTGSQARAERSTTIRWAEKETYAAFLAMADADSTTVDPHKMGYVPYPAGLVAFRNGLVTELIVQRAQYISDEAGGMKALADPSPIKSVGPYILEGSKAGSVALSCWLAHKTIPLDTGGHGQIVRATLLSAKKLFKYLVNHRHMFTRFHKENFGIEECSMPFTFVPLFEPDTNILLFVAKPMTWQKGNLIDIDVALKRLNALNEHIYEAANVPAQQRYARVTSAQPFYVSRTRVEPSQYSVRSLSPLLARLGIDPAEYAERGIFVLRSAVMNPWYYEAQGAGLDYLLEFVRFLHKVSFRAICDMGAEELHEVATREAPS